MQNSLEILKKLSLSSLLYRNTFSRTIFPYDKCYRISYRNSCGIKSKISSFFLRIPSMKLSFEIIFQTLLRVEKKNSKPYKSTVTLHPLKLTLETRRRVIYKKKSALEMPHKECKRHPSLAINNSGIGIRRITNPGVKVIFRGKKKARV